MRRDFTTTVRPIDATTVVTSVPSAVSKAQKTSVISIAQVRNIVKKIHVDAMNLSINLTTLHFHVSYLKIFMICEWVPPVW